jgi:TolB-like protein
MSICNDVGYEFQSVEENRNCFISQRNARIKEELKMDNNFDLFDFMIWNSPQIKDELNSHQKTFEQLFMNKNSELKDEMDLNMTKIEALVKSKKENLKEKFSQIEKLWYEINDELMKKTILVLVVFVSVVVGISAQAAKPLDSVIDEAAKSIEVALPQGTKLAVLNFTSGSETFSDYVIEELTGVLVTGRKVTIVDRRELALIREEMNLQMSGDVSDDSARAIGKQLGAQSIVSGSLTNLGTYFRFRIKVINVETAEIQIQSSFNLQNDKQAAFLLETAPATAVTPANTSTTAQTAPAATTRTMSGSQDRHGLYVNGAFQRQMDLMDAVDWIALNARSGGNYLIVLRRDEAVPYISLSYNNQQVTESFRR